jgi:thiamine-monophosphate kinase
MSEFALIGALVERLGGGPADEVPLGPGDDAAIVTIGGTAVAVTVDAMVDAVHFDRALSSAADVGWKLVAVNVSDLAAIGARPIAAVVALHLPDGSEREWVLELADGVAEAAGGWGVRVVGGDVVSATELAVSMTLLGEVPAGAPLTRAGARAGDALVLIGETGLAGAGLALAQAGEDDLLAEHPELLAAHRRPVARITAGRALAEVGAHAAIDTSDGLGQDAGHVAEASAVGIVIREAAVPMHPGVRAAEARLGRDGLALHGGEDLALLATVDPADVGTLRQRMADLGEPFAVIGEVRPGSGVSLLRCDGTTVDASRHGYEHGRTNGGGRT